MNIVSYVLIGCIVIIIGIFIGNKMRQNMRKTMCPYCSCRDCCDIGYGVSAVCSDEEQKPIVCRK